MGPSGMTFVIILLHVRREYRNFPELAYRCVLVTSGLRELAGLASVAPARSRSWR